LKVCYALAYRAPNYIRTKSILEALRRIPGLEVFEAINENTGAFRYIETFRKTREIKERHDPDVYVLGFRGHEFYWPLRRLVGDKPIILDALMSPYASLSRERKHGRAGALGAMAWRAIEHSILKDADLLLTDTFAHCNFYEQEFLLPAHKLLSVPVGANEPDVSRGPQPPETTTPSSQQMTVLFYGSFLPLHGIDVILDAAQKVRDLPIRFDFVGGSSRQASRLASGCTEREITRYTHREWMEFDELINTAIPNADICLGGPFGNTDQARRVITGKTSQCLALGKPTIIGEIDEDHGFIDKENCLLIPQGNPGALAEALRWAYIHQEQLCRIGEQGRAIYAEKLSIKVIGDRLGKAIFDLVPNQ
jgi:glycosyltransferase involved in cell wall biosynthesis